MTEMPETSDVTTEGAVQNSPKPSTIPKTIEFDHPFFSSIAGAHFLIRDGEDDPVMVTPLDSGNADLKFSGIIHELGLSPDSDDVHMLSIVTIALQYVQGIGVGDPVPSEMHSGQASWNVTEEHRQKALTRLSALLVHWLAGDENAHIGPEQLASITDDPAMKAKVNEAFGEAAERLGMGRDKREEVIDIVNGLSEELAYIEALRSQFEHLSLLEDRLHELTNIYKSEMSVTETITAVNRLLGLAMTDFRDTFRKLDSRTNKIIEALQNVAAQVKFIRHHRDTLHRRLWAWHDLLEKWHQQPAMHSPNAEKLLHETYRFLAQRFLPQQEWELFFNVLERQTGKSSEKIW